MKTKEKNMKRILAILLVFVMLFSMASCGGKGDAETDGDQIKNEQQETENKDDQDQADDDKKDENTDDSENVKDDSADKKDDSTVSKPAGGSVGNGAETQKPAGGSTDTPAKEETVGQILLKDFNSRVNDKSTTLSLAEGLISNSIIEFYGGVTPMEIGVYMPGLGEFDVSGYKECTSFGPMMSSIAFIGYIFELEEGTDADEFEKALAEHANPRWNVCVTADETTIDTNGRFVFFLMAPMHFEDAPADEF